MATTLAGVQPPAVTTSTMSPTLIPLELPCEVCAGALAAPFACCGVCTLQIGRSAVTCCRGSLAAWLGCPALFNCTSHTSVFAGPAQETTLRVRPGPHW